MIEVKEKRRYMVRWDGIKPTLIWLDSSYEMKPFRLGKWTQSEDLGWAYVPELDGIHDHPERFPGYQEITEEEAEKVKEQLEAENDRIEKELTRTCVKRSSKKTKNGVTKVVTYRKVSKWRDFSLKEYIDILLRHLEKKGMTLQKIDYSYFDEWDYIKHRSIKEKSDIRQMLRDGADEIEASFSDAENTYVLRAPFRMHTIELEAVPKKKETRAEGDAT